MDKFKNLRGTFDILPAQLVKWQNIENIIKIQLSRSFVKEIRTPILEMTELFTRGIGENTDVVSKEMYTFKDRGDRSCTLRPEGTASVVRALINNGLSVKPQQKLWYMGPMFRYERPQAGRQRQFHQFGVEFIGYESYRSDVEIISLAWDILQKLGIKNLNLEINSLGNTNDRQNYQQAFKKFLDKNYSSLDSDSQKRVNKNPMRILDTKNKDTIQILKEAPILVDFLCDESLERYCQIKEQLKFLKIPFEENYKLVRGLDYYTHTAFEITSGALGSQATVCGGGRYDNLIKLMGGNETPAIGFAIGLERLIILAGKEYENDRLVDVYLVNKGSSAENYAIELTRKLRKLNIFTELDTSGTSFSKQFKKANKLNAKSVIVIGEEEAMKKEFLIRLFNDQDKENKEKRISFDDDYELVKWLKTNLREDL